MLLLVIVYMFLLAANKLLVDTQEDVEILQERVSTLTWELNEKAKKNSQLIESRKSKNKNTFIIVLVHDFMYNEYPIDLISRIAEVSAWFKSDKVKFDNLEFSQRLDEIVTDETSADKQKEINQFTREKEGIKLYYF